jgi:hypothetical protein
MPPENNTDLLPDLDALTTTIDPAKFGGTWTVVDQPGTPAKCIPPWCRIYIRVRIVVTKCWPIIFQIATRSQPSAEPPPGPDPGDPATMFIMTTRAAQEFGGDVDGDGAVGTPDFNGLRGDFGRTSIDR